MLKEFFEKHQEKIYLGIILALGLAKFVHLKGGVVLGEPDEQIHLEILRNFRSGDTWPVFAGRTWAFNFPLFLYLGWAFSYVFGVSYVPFRIISVISSLSLAFGIYFWLRWKLNHDGPFVIPAKAGIQETRPRIKPGITLVSFLAALFWLLCPLVVFYSRLGLIEMMVTSLIFLSLFAFDYAVTERKLKWSAISGVLLGLAILTKYTAFIFVAGMVAVWLLRVTLRAKRRFLRLFEYNCLTRQLRTTPMFRLGECLNTARKLFAASRDLIDGYSFLPLAIAGLIAISAALVFYFHDSFTFKLQAGQSLGIFTDWWKEVGGGFWDVWWPKTAWWLSWSVLVLGLIGVFVSLISGRRDPPSSRWPLGLRRVSKGDKGDEGKRRFLMFGFFFILTTFLITTRKPFNPRYFLPLVPFLCVYAALALGRLARAGRFFLRLFAHQPAEQAALAAVLGGIGMIGVIGWLGAGSWLAYCASNHGLIEQVGSYVLANSQKPKASGFLFSNWWPRYFGEASGIKNATWLAESVKETAEFADTSNRSALTILTQEGGVVVLESLYSKDLYTPNVRKVAQDLVERNASPITVIKDYQPNFPFYKESYNEVRIYVIEEGIRFK